MTRCVGNSNEKTLRQRWDVRSYQDHHNDWTLNGNDSFLVELAKYGMGKRDMAANLNLFSKVDTDDLGNMHFDADNSQPGDYIDLRFEMDTLVVFHTCPHPMNNADSYPKKPIAYEFYKADEVAEDDYCKTLCAENGRGLKIPISTMSCRPEENTVIVESALKIDKCCFREVVEAGGLLDEGC